MSVPRLTKKYKKLAKECNLQFFRNKTYLITDSKGDCVKRVSPSIGRFEIISKKGTNFADNDFIRKQVKSAPNQIGPKSNRPQVKSTLVKSAPNQIDFGPKSNRPHFCCLLFSTCKVK